MSIAKLTTDLDQIRQWAESRGGHPAALRNHADNQRLGVLFVIWPGEQFASELEELDWGAWFDAFEAQRLAFLYREYTTEGLPSHFFKVVTRASGVH